MKEDTTVVVVGWRRRRSCLEARGRNATGLPQWDRGATGWLLPYAKCIHGSLRQALRQVLHRVSWWRWTPTRCALRNAHPFLSFALRVRVPFCCVSVRSSTMNHNSIQIWIFLFGSDLFACLFMYFAYCLPFFVRYVGWHVYTNVVMEGRLRSHHMTPQSIPKRRPLPGLRTRRRKKSSKHQRSMLPARRRREVTTLELLHSLGLS
jgi:hypothetical protein